MDQRKIGAFLKALRKEQGLTQEQLAELLHVSGRTVSRWETGSNMPDIGMLVELAEQFDVSIPEIIQGERKSEMMNQETRETAAAMAEYGRNELKLGKQKVVGILLLCFGVFIIVSALAVFPSESSWGSIYSVLGMILSAAGLYLAVRQMLVRRGVRLLVVFGYVCLLSGVFALSDYVAVARFHQVPRFSYRAIYDSRQPDQVLYKTLFLTRSGKIPARRRKTSISSGNEFCGTGGVRITGTPPVYFLPCKQCAALETFVLGRIHKIFMNTRLYMQRKHAMIQGTMAQYPSRLCQF